MTGQSLASHLKTVIDGNNQMHKQQETNVKAKPFGTESADPVSVINGGVTVTRAKIRPSPNQYQIIQNAKLSTLLRHDSGEVSLPRTLEKGQVVKLKHQGGSPANGRNSTVDGSQVRQLFS